MVIMDHSTGGHRPPNARKRRESGSDADALTSEMVTTVVVTDHSREQEHFR